MSSVVCISNSMVLELIAQVNDCTKGRQLQFTHPQYNVIRMSMYVILILVYKFTVPLFSFQEVVVNYKLQIYIDFCCS